MSEKAFMQTILDAARLLNWACYHTYNSRRSAPGFPDVVCVKPGRLVVIECKTERGKVSFAQSFWLDMLDTVPGVRAMVARPSDWDAVEALLRDAA